ncbi:AAA family ATPase [Hoeflea marina]|nr:AAA family ATPase [Hoeflea marina]
MPDGTFNQWFSGKYDGRLDTQNEKVERWIVSVDEMAGLAATVPVSPGFIKTRTAGEITDTLVFAQMMPDFVTITAAAGTGKTFACKQFAVTRPNVFMVTMSPHTKTVHGMLVELATALDITQHNPAKLVRAVGRRLLNSGGGSLLIVDEAQNLVDSAVDQLRHFVDIYSCGVALVGNEEIYSRFSRSTDGPSYAQIKRRIGKRVRLAKPRAEDINALLDAWGISEPDTRKVLTGIGMKDGALGQIDKTLKLASMTAAATGQAVNAAMVRAAWSNRDVEGM